MSKLVPRAFKLLNSQMNRKLLTSHYQLAAAYWFDQRNYEGIHNYFKKESDQMRDEGIDFGNYLSIRGNQPDLQNIKFKSLEWEKPLGVFQSVFKMQLDTFTENQRISTILREIDEAAANFVGEKMTWEEAKLRKLQILVAKVKSYEHYSGLLWHLNKEID